MSIADTGLWPIHPLVVAAMVALAGCAGAQPVGERVTSARAQDGSFISWHEHIIDDPETAGFLLNGSDGLVMADIDQDGYEDIVSVHEFDSSYDSATYRPGFEAPADGHVRIAFASADPTRWENVTVAEGGDAPAPEDADAADVNGDGYPDIIVAAELSHLIYLQNPGPGASRTASWPRLILPMTQGRGSYIRVFLADLDGDGTPEAISPNKGAQMPGPADFAEVHPVSVFRVTGDPLRADGWQETVLGEYSVPQNSEPVDLDGDGDLDIVVGSRGENRLVWFENLGTGVRFAEHPVDIAGAAMAGFNLEYADLNDDGRLDIVGASADGLSWIEQPAHPDRPWTSHYIGTFAPDIMLGLEIADIDGDGDVDVMAGSYSRGDREDEAATPIDAPLGRLGWFENPGRVAQTWTRHDVSRRKRGMFDKFVARDADGDGDMDFYGTRGNSLPYDGVFWLEQVRSERAVRVFKPARSRESREVPLAEAAPGQ